MSEIAHCLVVEGFLCTVWMLAHSSSPWRKGGEAGVAEFCRGTVVAAAVTLGGVQTELLLTDRFFRTDEEDSTLGLFGVDKSATGVVRLDDSLVLPALLLLVVGKA